MDKWAIMINLSIITILIVAAIKSLTSIGPPMVGRYTSKHIKLGYFSAVTVTLWSCACVSQGSLELQSKQVYEGTGEICLAVHPGQVQAGEAKMRWRGSPTRGRHRRSTSQASMEKGCAQEKWSMPALRYPFLCCYFCLVRRLLTETAMPRYVFPPQLTQPPMTSGNPLKDTLSTQTHPVFYWFSRHLSVQSDWQPKLAFIMLFPAEPLHT